MRSVYAEELGYDGGGDAVEGLVAVGEAVGRWRW